MLGFSATGALHQPRANIEEEEIHKNYRPMISIKLHQQKFLDTTKNPAFTKSKSPTLLTAALPSQIDTHKLDDKT